MTADRHIVAEWLKAFCLVLVVVTGLLVIQIIEDDLDNLVTWQATGEQMFTYLGLRLPAQLPIVVPISLLISVILSLGGLHRSNGITALRAAGMSLTRITRSLWLAGVALTGLLVWLNAWLVPWSVEAHRDFADRLRFDWEEQQDPDTRTVGLVPALGFANQEAGRLWFMNRFGARDHLGFGVTVSTRDDLGRETRRIMAREVYYDDVDEAWVFLDGRELTFDPASGEAIRSLPFERRAFPGWEETPDLMLALNKEPKDLSWFEIRDILGTLARYENPSIHAYQVRFHNMLAAPFSCLVVLALAIPFAVTGVRTHPMVGASKTLAGFIAYYVLANACGLLGERNLLAPPIAAWLPNVLVLAVAGVFLYRAR
ncbi:MAG: LptF/LptG family permease [Opitutales bacterium]